MLRRFFSCSDEAFTPVFLTGRPVYIMKKLDYLPPAGLARVSWLGIFADKLSAYASRYSITPAEVSYMIASAAFLAEFVPVYSSFDAFKEALTHYTSTISTSSAANDAEAQKIEWMSVDEMASGPVPELGILERVCKLVCKIKDNPEYNIPDGLDMGIEHKAGLIAAPVTDIVVRPQAIEIKPVISARRAPGGQIEVSWIRAGHPAIEIQTSLDGGSTWHLFSIETIPNYIDTTARFPLGRHIRIRSYRAIYRDGGERVGSWSDTVTVLPNERPKYYVPKNSSAEAARYAGNGIV